MHRSTTPVLLPAKEMTRRRDLIRLKIERTIWRHKGGGPRRAADNGGRLRRSRKSLETNCAKSFGRKLFLSSCRRRRRRRRQQLRHSNTQANCVVVSQTAARNAQQVDWPPIKQSPSPLLPVKPALLYTCGRPQAQRATRRQESLCRLQCVFSDSLGSRSHCLSGCVGVACAPVRETHSLFQGLVDGTCCRRRCCCWLGGVVNSLNVGAEEGERERERGWLSNRQRCRPRNLLDGRPTICNTFSRRAAAARGTETCAACFVAKLIGFSLLLLLLRWRRRRSPHTSGETFY